MDGLKPKKKRFLPVADRPSADMVARQMEVAVVAYRALGSVESARRFLNDIDEPLGGRPLDVAGASVEGLKSVTDALNALSHQIPSADEVQTERGALG